MPAQFYLNGHLLPVDQPSMLANDLALLRGYGIFDYFVFENRQPRFLDAYLSRFMRSAALLRLPLELSKEQLAAAIHEVIEANGVEKGGMQLLLTGGYSEDRYTPIRPNFIIEQHDYPVIPAAHFTQGVRVQSLAYARDLPEVKSINYLVGIHRQPWLREKGADFLLYHDTYVRESDRSNFFIVDAAGQLRTATDQILAGITRQKVLEVAPAIVPVALENFTLADTYTAREAFLTSSTKGVMPVTYIDGRPVGDGRPGSITQQLGAAFLNLVDG